MCSREREREGKRRLDVSKLTKQMFEQVQGVGEKVVRHVFTKTLQISCIAKSKIALNSAAHAVYKI